MTTTSSKTEDLSKALENLLEIKAAADKTFEPWHQALKLVRTMQIDAAALTVARSCDRSLMNDPIKKMILNEISNLAVLNKIEGAGIDSMWATAAEYGHHDLAYNAGNQILWGTGHKTVDDYKLASRYYHMAIEKSQSESIKYSALTNYAEIVREGLISGTKDWIGAIRIYEDAASNGLVNAMFNAGNVLLWLVEAGDTSYAKRAEDWFTIIINHVESGAECIDLGGMEDAADRARRARLRLAGMHLDGFIENSSLEVCEDLISKHKDDEYAVWLNKRLWAKRLISKSLRPGKFPSSNWVALFSAMGWSLKTERFQYGIVGNINQSGYILDIATKNSAKMTILAFDYFTHSDFDVEETYLSIAMAMSDRFQRPIFVVGSKGFFVHFENQMFDVIHVAHNGNYSLAPIWPGATSDDVMETLGQPLAKRFTTNRNDLGNTIPRIINSLDEGFSLNGNYLPNAIWLMADKELAMPIHRANEPRRIGLRVNLSSKEIGQALERNLQENG
jgi:hypothetical protein